MARRRDLSGRRWSHDDLDLLRGMAATGVTMQRAAAVLGRAHCAVACKATRERIRFRGNGRRSDPVEKRLSRNAVLGSAKLREAILGLGSDQSRESR